MPRDRRAEQDDAARAFEAMDRERERDRFAPQPIPDAPEDRRRPGTAIGVIALLLGWVWIVGSLAGVYAVVGPDVLIELQPAVLAALAAGAFLPALMVWFAGATAQEGARARAEARRLADAAETFMNPAPQAEAATRRVAVAVRGEITALERALDQTLTKLHEVDGLVNAHSAAVEDMAARAQDGAGAMVSGLDMERAQLQAISHDLAHQATLIGDTISRHARLIAEAARLAEVELRGADDALDARISSFGAAAALISDRTHALTLAAQASADSALRLENALTQALEVLAKATSLTDAARQSAADASLAANATAGAVRETTARAVEDARRAAEQIRAEAAALGSRAHPQTPAGVPDFGARPAQPEPQRTRPSAADTLRSRIDRPATPAANDEGLSLPNGEPVPRALFSRGPSQPTPPRPRAPAQQPTTARDRPSGAPWAAPGLPPAPPTTPDAPVDRAAPGSGGAWTWRELLASIDQDTYTPTPPPQARREEPPAARVERPRRDDDQWRGEGQTGRTAQPMPEPIRHTPAPARSEPESLRVEAHGDDDPIARLTRAVTGGSAAPREQLPAVLAIEESGVRLPEVFSMAALDRIAHRARNGTQARRRAVRDAAGDAVGRVAAYLDNHSAARQEASAFLNRDGARIAELLGRGRASMSAEATRAFLLLDAALG